MLITVIVLALAIVLFVNAKLRSDMVAVCALAALLLSGVLSPEEGLSGFSHSIVIMMIGLFVVGGGIFRTGLAKMISGKILRLAGRSQIRLYILVMLVTSAIGAFVSNTGTVALMLPVVVSMAAGAAISSRRLLMPLAFASSMGGMMTLIGTPPNLVVNSALTGAGYGRLSFFAFFPVGILCVTLGLALLWPLTRIFLSGDDREKEDDTSGNNKSLKELANEYQLAQNLFRVRVKRHSLLTNRKIGDLQITLKYKVSILEIRRKPSGRKPFMRTIDQKIAAPDTVINDRDILYVMGSFADVRAFAEDNHLDLVDAHETEETVPVFSGRLLFDEIGIAEVVVMSHSKLVNQKVKDSGFRQKYHVNILGIQRHDKYLLQDLKEEKIQSGDSLLVQGEWHNIARLSGEQSEWVVVGQPLAEASKVTLDHKAPLAAIIMTAMVACMALNIVPAVTAVMSAAILMVLTGCFHNVEEAYKTINWESIVLIGAMLPMSLALEKTGVSTIISRELVGLLGQYHPVILLGGIYLSTSILTLFISNTATAVLFAPIALRSAVDMGVSPYPFLFAVTVAASMCFASPFSTPPNALVMSAGRYTFMDYVKVGLPLQLIFGVVMVGVLPVLFPF
jgi:di/tricarboxylate transporter